MFVGEKVTMKQLLGLPFAYLRRVGMYALSLVLQLKVGWCMWCSCVYSVNRPRIMYDKAIKTGKD